MSPRVWSIAGMDPSGYAGSQVDVTTLKNLGVSACSVLTAVTSQNAYQAGEIHFLPAAHVQAEIKMLLQQEAPAAIKIGMLGRCDLHQTLLLFLKDYSGKVVLDPVLHSSSGTALYEGDGKTYVLSLIQLFPWVDILTPNISEAEQLLGRSIASTQEVEQAAKDLVLLGAKSVLLKGGHWDCGLFSQDYWTDGKDAFWLANVRLPQKNYRGTGCTLSSAIAAALALGYSQKDVIVIANMYVHQAIRLSSDLGANTAQLFHGGWPEAQEDLPYLSPTPLTQLPLPFPKCKTGLYPIVDSSAWVQRLLSTAFISESPAASVLPLPTVYVPRLDRGIQPCIQLRVKNLSAPALEQEIKQSLHYAAQAGALLFINDYWELAIALGAKAVHLGQEDIEQADIDKIREAGLYLGVSTHCYYEVARAHALNPSYMACGPIYETTSKIMRFHPQGLDQLYRFQRTLSYPLVAIGGITLERLPQVVKMGVEGVSVISAITQAKDPEQALQQFLEKMHDSIAR